MSRFEKLKGKMDDEIKLAGLEALVPEELGKLLISHSNRLRTFEDASGSRDLRVRSWVWELVIQDRVTRVFVNTRIPWMLGLFRQAKENGH